MSHVLNIYIYMSHDQGTFKSEIFNLNRLEQEKQFFLQFRIYLIESNLN